MCKPEPQMILYINACVRNNSRTQRLADKLIETLEGDVEEVKLAELSFPQTTGTLVPGTNVLVSVAVLADGVVVLKGAERT